MRIGGYATGERKDDGDCYTDTVVYQGIHTRNRATSTVAQRVAGAFLDPPLFSFYRVPRSFVTLSRSRVRNLVRSSRSHSSPFASGSSSGALWLEKNSVGLSSGFVSQSRSLPRPFDPRDALAGAAAAATTTILLLPVYTLYPMLLNVIKINIISHTLFSYYHSYRL